VKTLCLICGENISVLKEYNIASHYNLKNKEKHKNCINAARREKVMALQRVLQSQKNVSRKHSKQSNDSSSALQQVTVLLTCLLKEANLFLMENS
jgi:hypothetical protein